MNFILEISILSVLLLCIVRYLSQKFKHFSPIYALVCVFAVLFAGGCILHGDSSSFTNDPEVRDAVARNRVGLIDRTGGVLRIGNGRISNLDPSKYYLIRESVHECDCSEDQLSDCDCGSDNDKEVSIDEKYIMRTEEGNGIRTESLNLVYIQKIPGTNTERGSINELTNYRTTPLDENEEPMETYLLTNYIVYAARLFDPGEYRIINNDGEEVRKTSLPQNGIISIQAEWVGYKLDLSNILSDGMNANVTIANGHVTLDFYDYIFHTPDSDPLDTFRYLSVRENGNEQGEPIQPPRGPINIALTIIDGNPVLSPPSAERTVNQLLASPVVINITNAASLGMQDIVWRYKNEQIGTGQTLNLVVDNIDPIRVQFLLTGTHIINVECEIQGVPYSASFELIVTDPPP